MKVDLLYQHYKHFVYVGKARQVIAEVFLLDESYIMYNQNTREGKIRVAKAV